MTDPSPRRPRAFVDESYRTIQGDTGIYVLAAVMVTADAEDTLRGSLRRTRPGKVARRHWRDDRSATRRRGTRLFATHHTALTCLVVVAHQVARRAQERARGDALWNLVFALQRRKTDDIVLEARERRQNDRDVATLQRILRVPDLTGARYTFTRPLDEPLLWLPDYLAGAVGEQLRGGTDAYVDLLPAGFLERIDLPGR